MQEYDDGMREYFKDRDPDALMEAMREAKEQQEKKGNVLRSVFDFSTVKPSSPCPCGSGNTYKECCRKYIKAIQGTKGKLTVPFETFKTSNNKKRNKRNKMAKTSRRKNRT